MKTHVLRIALTAALAFPLLPLSLDSRQSSPNTSSIDTAIRALLDQQQAAWNRGDVTVFMNGYWNSPELTFAGASGITRGWEPVMARYRKTYPDSAAMGHLDFSIIEIRLLGNDAALALGRWHLQRDTDEPAGVFTLVLQRFPEGWRIIHDHTSADLKP